MTDTTNAAGTGLPLYGIDKDIAARENAKRDLALEGLVQQYLEHLSGDPFPGGILESLRNGIILCKAMNAVVPGAIPKYNESPMPFKQMENISNFLKACRTQLKMSEHDLFTTADLFDGKSVVNVTNGIVAFSRAATKNGYQGPTIAPKESTGGSTRRWTITGSDGSVSKMNMGSAGIMERSKVDINNDISFGAKTSGVGDVSSTSKMNHGSHGFMDRSEVSRSNDITFGHNASK